MQGGGPALQSLKDGLLDLLAWWRDELRGLMPERARRFLGGEQPSAVLAQVEFGFQVLQGTAGRGGPVMPREEALMELAALARKGMPVGIRLPLSLCFSRTVELPGAARKDLRRILDFELERATPFKQRDVYTAHTVEGQADTTGRLRVRQLVAKRELVDPLVAEVRQAGVYVAFVDCWSGQPGSGLAIDFLAASAPAGSGVGRL